MEEYCATKWMVLRMLADDYQIALRAVLNRTQQHEYDDAINAGFIPITPYAQSDKYPKNGIIELIYAPFSNSTINNIKLNKEEGKKMLPKYLAKTALPVGAYSDGTKGTMYRNPRMKDSYSREKFFDLLSEKFDEFDERYQRKVEPSNSTSARNVTTLDL